MRKICCVIIFFGAVLLSVFSILTSPVGQERFMLYRADMENYLDDLLYKNLIQPKGTSYLILDDYLYTYGKYGFAIVDLENGSIRYLFDSDTNEWFKNRTAPKLAKQPRTKEGLHSMYLTILPNASALSQQELAIMNRLKLERVKYPLEWISSGSMENTFNPRMYRASIISKYHEEKHGLGEVVVGILVLILLVYGRYFYLRRQRCN